MTQATELRELATLLDVSSGKVGIGLPSGTPSNSLVISDGVRTSAAITAGTTALEIARTGGGDVGILINKDTAKWLIGVDNSDGNAGPLRFLYGAYNAAAHPGFGTDYSGLNLSYDGAVGIGTKTPSDPLHVDTVHEVVARFESNSNNGTNLVIANADATTGRKAIVNLAPANNVTGALIGAEATEDFSSSAARTADLYFTTRANGTLEEKVRILSNGDVGIGTNAPVHKLDVDGAIATRQVRHSISPTLNLDFANSKQLDSRITFYRDSVATYYSKEGKLMYATNNEPRFDHDPVTGESKGLMIEGTVTNSIVNSNPMRWTGNNGVYVVDNAAKAPDGTYSAVKIQDIASTNSIFHGTYQHVSVTNGVAYTISGYFKAGTEDVVGFRMYDGSSMAMRGHFNLNSGTPSLINGTSIHMQDVGDGWYRCSIVGTATNTTTTADVYIFTTSVYTHTSTGDNSIYAWGIQHEANPILSSYMPTDTKFSNRSTTASYYDKDGIVRYAPRDTPRYGYKYDGRKWVETGLITENAATNTVSYSHFQDGWGIPNVRHGYGEEITAPDGTTIRSVTANSTYNLIRQSNVFDNTTAGTATLSFWAKAISTTGSESITFDFGDMAGSGFNAASGLTSEWKRFTYTQSWTANQTIHNFLDFSMGNNTEIGLWGIQVETGSEATSYIPTYDTDAIRVADTVLSQNKTRTSDSAYIDGKHFEDFYNPDEGTMYIDYQLGAKLASFRILALTKHNTNTDFIEFIGGWGAVGATTGGVYMFGPNSTGSPVNTAGSTITNVAYERRKFAGRISHNDFYSVTQNSTSIAQAGDTDAGIPVVERLNFGDYNHTDSQKMFGHIRKVVYYPEALTNAELIALTENN